jgi:hypothetical protein
MSKIAIFEFVPFAVRFRNRIRGTITMPRDAKILYLGAGPPKGNLYCWAEVSSIEQVIPQNVSAEYTVLMLGDEIPPGHEFAAPLFANPILFVYRLSNQDEFSKARETEPVPAPGDKPTGLIAVPGRKKR